MVGSFIYRVVSSSMSHARSPPDRRKVARGTDTESERSPAAKVVLMELARADRPLGAEELRDRTLLSETAVESTVSALVDRGLCTRRAGDERRPPRFEVELPPEAAD